MVTRLLHAAALGPLLMALLALLWTPPVDAQQAPLTARIDREQVGLDEPITLEIRVEVQGRVQFGRPDSPDFEVVGQASQTSQRFDGSGAYSSITRIYRLRPLRTGNLTIPPVTVQTSRGVMQTQSFAVQVLEAGAGSIAPQAPQAPAQPQIAVPQPTGTAPQTNSADPRQIPSAPSVASDVWAWGPLTPAEQGAPVVVARISSSTPTAGEQLIVDYLLLSPVTTFGLSVVSAAQPEFNGLWFRDVGESRASRRSLGTHRVNGEMYEVNLVSSYLVVPLEPGTVTIPTLTLTLVLDSFQFGRRQIAASSVPLQVEVASPASPPAGADPDNVGRFVFDVSAQPRQATAGQPVSLVLRVSGSGLLSRLELPSLPPITGVRTLDPTDTFEQELGRSGWLEGWTSRTITLIPEQAGTLEVPALSFVYWDPFVRAWQTATSEPIAIRVEPGAPVAGPGSGAAPSDVLDSWTDRLPQPRTTGLRPKVGDDGFWGSGLYFGLLAVPPVVGFGWAVVAALLRRRARLAPVQHEATVGQRAVAALRAAPRDAVGAAEASQAISEYLDTRLQRPTRGLVAETLTEAATTTLGEAGARLVAAQRTLAAARFSGDTAALADALDAAVAAIEAAERAR